MSIILNELKKFEIVILQIGKRYSQSFVNFMLIY